MKIRKFVLSAAMMVMALFAAGPAKAGIPVIDGANLAQQIQQVISWTNQAQQMIDQINKLQAQISQLQTMTSKLEGIRNLGTILNDPTISSVLPADMRDASQLLLNPTALTTSTESLNQIMSAFGVNAPTNGTSGKSAADALGKIQQILSSTQSRATQLQALATRVNTTTDAKDSLDMVNRNVLEAANVSNQMTQTMAAIEAQRQAAALKKLAEDQAYFEAIKTGGSQPIRTFAY
ncbi:hypothetical protein EIP75_21585 [Aquabacterium soli]|uniref:Type IV secretion system protein VirB5 n=1 Tax=Aquabacterium soli TaxID=2493092 RepID=A0A426V2Y4_9BURK|nr:type IV secretion system protein [Aquabacterium soli]RRS01170.1 hypothetical protein EIP75_21585 [Aquabacterium soli]